MSKERLTQKQENIYNIIKQFINKNGYSPTFREIAKIAKLNSSGTIQEYIYKLKKKGYINYIPNKNRTIRIIK